MGSIRLVPVSSEFTLLMAAGVCTLRVRGGQSAREDVKEGTAAQRPAPLRRLDV
jgi:hypothetical protein